jgi:1,4-alpha-glucan branching enzyme
MIVCTLDPDTDTVTATFTVSGPELDEQQVSVVGDFNDWDPAATPMRKTPGRPHTATVTLQRGRRYLFRYRVAAGEWYDDETADAYEPNEFGGKNCVIDLVAVPGRESSA